MTLTRRTAIVLISVFSLVTVAAAGSGIAVLAGDRGPAAPSNPATRYGLVGNPIPVGRGPADVESGGGFVWVSSSDDGTITRIDPVTRAARTYEVGGIPGQIVVDDEAVWIRNLGDRITRLDIATGAVSPPIAGGAGPITGMAVGVGAVWLSHREEDVLTRVDTRTLAVAGVPLRVDRRPGVLEFGDGAVFAVGADGTISRIDAATATRVGTAEVGDSPGGVEVDGATVYVAADGGVVPVDARTLLPGPVYPFADWAYFEVADGVMWVVYDGVPRIQRFDAATRAPIGDPVPGLGDQVGRARYAFDRLWLTLPDRDEVVSLGPV